MDRASSNTPIQTRFFSGAVSLRPSNIEQVIKVEELISLFQHQMLDLPKLALLYQTLKVARLVMADRVVLNHINTEFLATNIQKQWRAQCIGIQYNGQGACILR